MACCLLVREKIRPAGAKEAKNAVFRCAGRTLSRIRCRTGALGEFCTGFGTGRGTKFSLLVQNWLKWAFLGVLGEFCTGWAAGGGVLGEFCTGWAAGGGVLGESCTGCVDVRSRVGDLPAAKG